MVGPDDMPGFFATLTPEQKAAALAYRGDDSHPQPAPQAQPGLVAWADREKIMNRDVVRLCYELDRRLAAMGVK